MALGRDILVQRERLITAEARMNAYVEAKVKAILDSWMTELRRVLRSGANLQDTQAWKLRALNDLKRITKSALYEIEKTLGEKLSNVARSELIRLSYLIDQGTVDIQGKLGVSFNTPSVRAVKAALSGDVPGASTSPAFANLSKNAMARLKVDLAEAIADGFNLRKLQSKWAAGKGAASMVRETATIARTAMMATSNNAAVAIYKKNKRLVRGLMWEATFDVRTCMVCGSRHGRVYTFENAPPLPAHYQCRCTWLPVFIDQALQASLETSVLQYKKFAASYTQADRNFEKWLRKQPATTKADFFPSELKRKAWTSRKLKLEEMVHKDGTIYTDIEVRKKLQSRGIRL